MHVVKIRDPVLPFVEMNPISIVVRGLFLQSLAFSELETACSILNHTIHIISGTMSGHVGFM